MWKIFTVIDNHQLETKILLSWIILFIISSFPILLLPLLTNFYLFITFSAEVTFTTETLRLYALWQHSQGITTLEW